MALIEADHFDTVPLTLDDSARLVDDRAEPMLDDGPIFVEFDEPAQLDPSRVGLTWELPPPLPVMRLRSPLTSLAVHLLPLLLILGWPRTPGDITPPIAVELVFEEPPEPPPQPQQQDGARASEDLGDIKPKENGTAEAATPPAPGEKAPAPAAAQTAAAAPAPPPIPPPKPAPPKEPAPVQLPKPAGAQAPNREESPRPPPRAARFAGPSATRDEYLNYLVSLTRQHIDLLPLSVVGGRRGETVVSVVVEDSGAISNIAVARSSGYRDIDQRIAQMVAAVEKFPPLPQWYQGKSVQLELTFRFPDALQQSQ